MTGRRQEQRRKLEQLVTRGRKRERSQDEDDKSDDDSDEDREGDGAPAAPATRTKAARREASPPQHRLGGGRQSPSPRPSPVRGLVSSLMS